MLLEIKELCKNYGTKEALKNFSFSFSPGIYGLLGPNGAGKTTFFSILTNNIKRSSGNIFYDGSDIFDMKTSYLKLLGYMPQQQGLYPDFTLKRFLYYMASLKGMSKAGIETKVEKVCERVNLFDAVNTKLGVFSGGMKQRALFAQAILDDPAILILDEPTAGLDPKERISLRNLIAEIAKEKIVIIATHIVSDVEIISDNILLLNNGELIRTGTPNELCDGISGSVFERKLHEGTYTDDIDKATISSYRKDTQNYIIRYIDKNMKSSDAVVSPSLEDVYLYYFGNK